MLGDCYFISSLGTIAKSNPAAIENMFINNGDETYTVRFYTGTYGSTTNSDGSINDGFTNGVGTADYVTVNTMLPTYNGTLVLPITKPATPPPKMTSGSPWRKRPTHSGTKPAKKAATAQTSMGRSRADGWPRSTPKCSVTMPPITI